MTGLHGPSAADYWMAGVCFAIAGLSLLALLVMAWRDRAATRRRRRAGRGSHPAGRAR